MSMPSEDYDPDLTEQLLEETGKLLSDSRRLLNDLEWFQIITLLNPLTYVSEGMRMALTGLPHLPTAWIILGIFVSTLFFGGIGLRGFVRRAVD